VQEFVSYTRGREGEMEVIYDFNLLTKSHLRITLDFIEPNTASYNVQRGFGWIF